VSDSERRSVPTPRKKLPRSLTSQEVASAKRLADALCTGGTRSAPLPSECEAFESMLGVALAARVDVFEDVTNAFQSAAAAPDAALWLRELSDSDPSSFIPLSNVLAGAYLLVPEIQMYVGYPGQGRKPASPTQIADELGDGLLDPVTDRGPIYRTP
jgi:hypothetical protein